MDIVKGGTARQASGDDIAETVLATIAEVTRYPRSVLALTAELEDELGIESVKRAEILAVLSKRLALPPPPADGTLGRLKTIADVIAVVEAALAASGAHGPAVLPSAAVPAVSASPVIAFPASVPVAGPTAIPTGVLTPVARPAADAARSPVAAAAVVPASSAIAETVIATIAEATRYPRSVLLPEAELEDELGIESVKRAEIVSVLGRKLGLEPPNDGSLGQLRTIADVVAAVERLMAGVSPAVVAPLPAPAVIRAFEPAASATGSSAGPRPAASLRRPVPEEVFAGKVALVTGSGHGLGKALVRHLAQLGASVVVNSFHSPERGGTTVAELSAEGRDAIHVWGSVANSEQLEQIFSAIEARHGHLDFLVHSASDAAQAPLAEITAEDWHRAFRTEIVGLHQAALRAAPLMARRGGGKIVTLTHPAAHRCFENSAVLGTVKAAVESLTRYLAVELGPKNIQVNAVCAGPLREQVERAQDAGRVLSGWASRSPGGRLPDESGVAAAVAFLLSDAASQMAGTTLVVDGGISLST